MNKVKIGIILCIILIIAIIIFLINIKKQNESMLNNTIENSIENVINSESNKSEIKTNGNGNIIIENINNHAETNTSENLEEVEYEVDSKMKKNYIRNLYFAIENSLNMYFQYIKTENKEAVYSILSDNYINENKITSNNVLKKASINDGFALFKVDKMYLIERMGNYANFVKGIITYNNNEKEEWYGLIEADIDYKYYQITPYSKQEYIHMVSIEQEVEENDIKQNKYNTMKSFLIEDEEMCKKYFNDYKDKMLNNIEEAYEFLDEEYKKENFPNIDIYKEYIENKKEEINASTISSCEVETEELGEDYEYRYNYIIKDNNSNVYIIIENAIMDYSVKMEK